MSPRAANWRAKVLFAVAACAALWVFWQSERLFRADWASMRERHEVTDWVSGASKPADERSWSDAHAALDAALDITPDDPDLNERMGDLHAVAGQRDWNDPVRRRAHFHEAARFYRRAIDVRPTEPTTWAMLAAASQAAGDDAAQVHAAWSRAVALGPYEGTVQPILMQVVLSDWAGATPVMQNWANRLFDQGNEATRRDINTLAARYGLVFSPDPVLPPP